jgi:hypothetical protein
MRTFPGSGSNSRFQAIYQSSPQACPEGIPIGNLLAQLGTGLLVNPPLSRILPRPFRHSLPLKQSSQIGQPARRRFVLISVPTARCLLQYGMTILSVSS